VVETSAIRCPPVAHATTIEARRTTKPPAADVTIDGAPAISDQAKAKWLDAHERAELRKNEALKGLIAEYQKCRVPKAGGGSTPSPQTPVKPIS